MKADTTALLCCIARRENHLAQASENAEEQPARCGGKLVIHDEHLECERCGIQYRGANGIPHILSPECEQDQYIGDEIIQTYYEAHYAPFIKTVPNLQTQLIFPPNNATRRSPKKVGSDGSVQVLEEQEVQGNHDLLRFYRSVTHLARTQQLTEEFYQIMLDLCYPYVTEQSIILDVGCGLGRMTAEMARMGAKHVIGLDRSPRMIHEAVRILGATGPIPVALNIIGENSIDTTIELPWVVQNHDFLVGDVHQIPLRDESFDVITCFNLLDRVRRPKQMIAELHRVLRTGGHLLMTDPYHWEEQYTPRQEWQNDMTSLFDSCHWQKVHEEDGIPFVLRYYSRRIAIYLNHCLIYRKVGADAE